MYDDVGVENNFLKKDKLNTQLKNSKFTLYMYFYSPYQTLFFKNVTNTFLPRLSTPSLLKTHFTILESYIFM